jgi:hypothetical protein
MTHEQQTPSKSGMDNDPADYRLKGDAHMSNIFHEARPQSAFLKMGIYGEAGTGKSFTSSLIAMGLHKFIKSTNPVFFMDTETGSDFLRDRFVAEKIPLMVAKTRAFADLVTAMDEIPVGSIVIIDSLTHYWNELIESYMKKNQKTRLTLRDWQPLKATWREYSDRFVNSKLHIIVAGRSADKWDEVEDDDGAKELKKVGTKMRAETEFAYEPSLLIEMQLYQVSPRIGAKIIHRAHVRKDRFDIINGMVFDDPGFEPWLPHIERLNLGGEHIAIETGRDSQAIFDDPNIGEKRALNKEILCEEIANEMKKLIPGQKEEDKLARIRLLEEVFGTNSWTRISTLFKNDDLAQGLLMLKAKVSLAFDPAPAKVEPQTPPEDGKKRKGARA